MHRAMTAVAVQSIQGQLDIGIGQRRKIPSSYHKEREGGSYLRVLTKGKMA